MDSLRKNAGCQFGAFWHPNSLRGQPFVIAGYALVNEYHIWVAPGEQPVKSKGMIVEATQRWKGANLAWALSTFQRLASQHTRVRITGWLMFDQEHPDKVGKSRATLWEIHPITRIGVLTGGQYRELQ